MSLRPAFSVADIGGGSLALNDRRRTVAFVTRQGYIDWLLKSPLEPGELVTAIPKETHLSYTRGLKLLLLTPTPETWPKEIHHDLLDDGARLALRARCESADGRFASETTAVLSANEATGRYEWDFQTTITCTAQAPVELSWIEYNNIYPGKCGRCMLFAPTKEYTCTLMVDRDGVAWRFAHQHLMHYSGKISTLHFAEGTMAGFFGEPTGNPVVIVERSTLEPDWAICDMYYDLHCCARPTGPIAPGEAHSFSYKVRYLGAEESHQWMSKSRPVPVTEDDWGRHTYPRLELGLNAFNDLVHIDRPDDASGFRPRPPVKVWDREEGHAERGSLRITNEQAVETVWSAEPPTQIPASAVLRITGMVKTKQAEGKGAFIRVRYHTFVWHPTPHVEWVQTLESVPVNGTTPGWVQVSVPELRVPAEHFDYLVWIDFVLDGKGVAWLTDVDVDLQPAPGEAPQEEKGATKARRRPARSGAGVGGPAGTT
jgi:hypothetical protein